MTRTLRAILVPLALAVLVAAGCGDSSDGGDDAADTDASGIRVVSVQEGADLQGDPPDGLVVLDVRTPEEFAEGHLDGALMIDFSLDDFTDRVADLDPDVPYLALRDSVGFGSLLSVW